MEFKKLKISEANEVLKNALNMKKKYPHTRMGQNVMNCLPTEINTAISGTELDMFNLSTYNDCVKLLFDERITIME